MAVFFGRTKVKSTTKSTPSNISVRNRECERGSIANIINQRKKKRGNLVTKSIHIEHYDIEAPSRTTIHPQTMHGNKCRKRRHIMTEKGKLDDEFLSSEECYSCRKNGRPKMSEKPVWYRDVGSFVIIRKRQRITLQGLRSNAAAARNCICCSFVGIWLHF